MSKSQPFNPSATLSRIDAALPPFVRQAARFGVQTVPLSLLVYTLAWLSTIPLGRLFWPGSLPTGNHLVMLADFLLPGLLVGGVALRSLRGENIFGPLKIFFIALLALVVLNLTVFHFPLNNFGDNGYLSTRIEHNEGFERWMLGSSILKSLYHSLWQPLAALHFFPVDAGADTFVRLTGALCMCGFSILALRRWPNRMALVLPLSLPIWLLLSSGYNEYYPFIAPLYLGMLIFLSEGDSRTLSPLWMGLLAAGIALSYAGFVPVSALLWLLYTLRSGVKKGLAALGFAALFSVLMLALLWPDTLPNFIRGYIATLSLGEKNTFYPSYEGRAMPYTPFFGLGYIFAGEHLRHVFFMDFWGGGLASLLALSASAALALRRRFTDFKMHRLNLLALGLLLGWQVLYLLIKIPRLGPKTDVDLFFSVYISLAFAAGLLCDELARGVCVPVKTRLQSIFYAMFAGSSASLLLFLLVWGLPTP